MNIIKKILFGIALGTAFTCAILLMCLKENSLSDMKYIALIMLVFVLSVVVIYFIRSLDNRWVNPLTRDAKLLVRKLPRCVRRRLIDCECELTDGGYYCAIYFIDKDGNDNFIDGYGIRNFISAVNDRVYLFK